MRFVRRIYKISHTIQKIFYLFSYKYTKLCFPFTDIVGHLVHNTLLLSIDKEQIMIVTSNLIQITFASQDPFSLFIRSTTNNKTKWLIRLLWHCVTIHSLLLVSNVGFIGIKTSLPIQGLTYVYVGMGLCIDVYCSVTWLKDSKYDSIKYYINHREKDVKRSKAIKDVFFVNWMLFNV